MSTDVMQLHNSILTVILLNVCYTHTRTGDDGEKPVLDKMAELPAAKKEQTIAIQMC